VTPFTRGATRSLTIIAAYITGCMAYATLPGWATAALVGWCAVALLVWSLCRASALSQAQADAERLGRRDRRVA